MKLPAITTGGMQRKEGPSIQLAMAESMARAGAMRKIGSDVSSALLAYEDRENNLQARLGKADVESVADAFDKRHAGRIEYGIMEVPPDLSATMNLETMGPLPEGEMPESTIPAYRVNAEMKKQEVDAAIQETAKRVPGGRARNEYTLLMQNYSDNQYRENLAAIPGQQLAYDQTKSVAALKEAQVKRQYDVAEEIINDYPTDNPQLKEDMRNTNTQLRQSDFMNEAIENGSLKEVNLALKALEENEEYATSQLDTKTQRIFTSMLNTRKNQLDNRDRQGVATAQALLKRQARNMIKVSEKGIPQDAAQYATVMTQMETLDPVLAADMAAVQNRQPNIATLMGMRPYDALDQVAALETQAITPDQKLEVEAYKQAVIQGQKERRTDMMGFLRKWKVVPGTEPLNPQDLVGSLRSKIAAEETGRRVYGASTGFLEKNEVPIMADMIENATTQQKTQIIGQISEALGGRAGYFYEQLKREGIADSFTVAGQASAEGDTVAAKYIIEGNDIRQNDPGRIGAVEKDLINETRGVLGAIYGSNNTQIRVATQAIMDTYAYLTKQAGEVAEADDVDSGRLEESIRQSTGGVAEYGDSTIVLPDRNTTEQSFGNWMDNIAPERIENMDAEGYTNEEIFEQIRDGDLVLANKGKGEYYIVNEDRQAAVQNKQGGAFVLQYDTTLTTRAEVSTEEKAREVARRGVEEQYPPGAQVVRRGISENNRLEF